nr:MAG TPA: hypothetical protein [Caudoviricetes sp.]DAL43722.1 MAG TPA_asm: hypothetical protein [Caudoviricetes sp.]DAT74006.1 MAG TPA: hypothetical protein [Caudoviricetes sp.]
MHTFLHFVVYKCVQACYNEAVLRPKITARVRIC